MRRLPRTEETSVSAFAISHQLKSNPYDNGVYQYSLFGPTIGRRKGMIWPSYFKTHLPFRSEAVCAGSLPDRICWRGEVKDWERIG
jgi:hypothetical protein